MMLDLRKNKNELLLCLVLLVTALPTRCQALLSSQRTKPAAIPDLNDLAPRLATRQLNYRLAVGDKETPFQMKDMHVDLTGSCKTPKKGSTGIHEANLLRSPSFVNDKGEQAVSLKNGGWEVTWGKDSPHGHLVCSFVSPEEVQRNDDATLEAGRFFMYHRVWTTETLESERERRRQIQSEAAKHLNDRDQKVKTITDEESNLGSKVVAYGQAAGSMRNFRNSGLEEARFVPLYDSQVLELASDCIVSSRGLVCKMDGGPVHIGESRVEFLKNET